LHVDPEFEALVPRPTELEYQALKSSLQREGQRDPIVVNPEGTVLDGHTRFRILKELGMPIKFKVLSLSDRKAEKDYVVKSSALRRNVTKFQKVKLAQDRLKEEREKAKQRQKLGKKQQTFTSCEVQVGDAISIVAEEFAVPESTFFKA